MKIYRNPRIGISKLLIVVVIVVIVVAAAGAGFYLVSQTKTNTSITSVTDYVGGVTTSAPQDFVAQAEGYFTQNHLSVNFVDLSGTSQAVQAVAADRSTDAFTEGDIADEMLIEAANQSAPPLITIAGGEPLNPVAILYLNGSGINSVADLKGKTIGVPSGSLSAIYLNAFLAKEGLSGQVSTTNIAFSALGPALLSKKVDAICEFARGLASLRIAAAPQGVSIFLFANYGVPPPLGGVVVQNSLVVNNPSVARAIANATTYALWFCVVNQVKCIQDFISANPGRDLNETLAEWDLALVAQYGINATADANWKPLQFGWTNPSEVTTVVPQLEQLFNITKTFDPTTLYTNQFVQAPPTTTTT